jgi:hypothetical protein
MDISIIVIILLLVIFAAMISYPIIINSGKIIFKKHFSAVLFLPLFASFIVSFAIAAFVVAYISVPIGEFGGPIAEYVIPSRIFSGPNQYQPTSFRAYGVVTFPYLPSVENRGRFLFICDAYFSTLPHSFEIGKSHKKQLVTVWPIDSDDVADHLNATRRGNSCDIAISHYGLVAAKRSLNDARFAHVDVSGIGPFLLAWSPSADKGKPEARVLVMDLSDVTTFDQAQKVFLRWSLDIEQNPELWEEEKGWNVDKVRVILRYWADKWGPKLLALKGPESK